MIGAVVACAGSVVAAVADPAASLAAVGSSGGVAVAVADPAVAVEPPTAVAGGGAGFVALGVCDCMPLGTLAG
jgi:hypothetical protein